jgi:RNA polymerase sigma-70 factor (ECF subfamily)
VTGPDPVASLAEEYDALRPYLTGVAYRIVGSRADAEDAVQDGWLRLQRLVSGSADDRPRNLRGWATTTVSRLALDLLGSARRRRETYVGQWLPEPWVSDSVGATPPGPRDADPADRVTLADSVSYALLVVLETLSPAERTSWVLHDTFGMSFDEVAEVVGRTPEACRQLAARARSRIKARAPRFEVDTDAQRRVVESFLSAATGGDLEGLIALLDPAATLRGDGGGKVATARHPVEGADRIARLMLGIVRLAKHVDRIEVAPVNGLPGVLGYAGETLVSVMSFAVADGRVTEIDVLVNPEKLARVQRTLELPR